MATSFSPENTLAPTKTSQCVVQAINLVRDFGPVRALDGLSLCIREGETYGLLGPNGSGKTTFIRMIAGLLNPTSGELTVLGTKMHGGAGKVSALIGYMPQLQALYSDLTVWENAQFFARIYGMDNAAQRNARVSEVLALVELLPRKASLVGTISGGMKQRLSLACALVHKPRLLLLDEPTVGVDPQLRQTFWGYFRVLNAQGVTIVVSSHVMDEADRCDRLGLVRAGKLLAEGAPDEIRRLAGDNNLESAFLALSGNEKIRD
jgi:ABC-2 type transport system ATP-binding protein